MNVDRPKLTPEVALQELTDQMKREEEMAAEGGPHSFSFNRNNPNPGHEHSRGRNPTPAQLLSHSLDHTNWQTPGLNDAKPADPNSPAQPKSKENPGA